MRVRGRTRKARRAGTAALILGLLFAAGVATAATVVTEYHVWSATTTIFGNGSRSRTITMSGTITDLDTYPDPVTITETVGGTTATTTTTTTTTSTTTGTTTTTPPPAGAIAPGQSWQTAYDAAVADSTLRVLAGYHSSPTVTGSKRVTFVGDEGAVVSKMPGNCPCTFENIDIDTGQAHGQYSGAEPQVPGIVFKDVNLIGDAPAIHVWATDFTWDGGSVHDRAIRRCSLGDTGVPIWLNNDRATIRNLDMGPFQIDDTVCVHGEDIRVQSGDDVTVSGVHFEPGSDTGSGHVFVTCGSSCTVARLHLADNVFEPIDGTYAIQIHTNVATYDSWTITGNRFDQDVLDYPRYVNLVACGNTGPAPIPDSWRTAC